ncbi:MAG: RNA-binding protein [Acidobacteriota bacterium]
MKLYIGNLPFHAREEELQGLFATYGAVGAATVIVDNQSGRSRGFGFVEFADPSHGKAAIAGVHGRELGGRTLVVNEARSQGGGPGDRRGSRSGYDGGSRGSDRGGRSSGGGEGRRY